MATPLSEQTVTKIFLQTTFVYYAHLLPPFHAELTRLLEAGVNVEYSLGSVPIVRRPGPRATANGFRMLSPSLLSTHPMPPIHNRRPTPIRTWSVLILLGNFQLLLISLGLRWLALYNLTRTIISLTSEPPP